MANLLLVEDDLEIRGLLERFLQKCGFVVTCTGDGESAIKLFTEGAYHVVLTDGLLPRKSGYDVAVAIRKQDKGKRVGVVMMTAAFKGAKARQDALDNGVDAFFNKPFILTDLKDKLVELAQRHGATVVPAGPAAPEPTAAARTDPSLKRKPEAPALPSSMLVKGPDEVARALLTCARHRLSGVVHFAAESSLLSLAFLRGVVVGASDNLRETLLGERLYKQGRLSNDQMRTLNARMASANERVAEALLALGYVSADEALGFVDEQAHARVRRALLWSGTLRVVEDAEAATRMAVSTLELVDVIIALGLEETQRGEADRFVAANKGGRLTKPPDWNTLLAALARVKPAASLPGVMLAGTAPTVVEAARAASPSEVYAAWLAGLVRLPSDPPPDPRALPEILKAEITSALVDRDVVNRICSLLLRARGRSFYDLLAIPRHEKSAVAIAKLAALAQEIGPDVLSGKSLGPAWAAARELWTILDDAYQTFADDGRRTFYDALTAAPAPAPSPPPARAPAPAPAAQEPPHEDAFLEGQQALAAGDAIRALACFEVALLSRPADVEYRSYHAWAQVLAGDDAGVEKLVAVLQEAPQSMRPLFFLGLVAAKEGDVPRARALLDECIKRAPGDVEVQIARGALG